MAFTNPITLGHKNLTEKTFTFATNVAAGMSSQDAMDAGAAFRLLSNNLTVAPVTTTKLDVFFTWTPAQQVDWLSSGAVNGHILSNNTIMASFPYGFWTSDHTTATLALPAENGLSQKSRRMMIMRCLWNAPSMIDPTTGTTFKNVWDSITTGMTYTEKLMIITYGWPTIGQASTGNTYLSNNMILDDIQLIISDIAANATGLSTRMLLLNYFIGMTSRNEMHYTAFMTDSNLLANLLAANADAKKALYMFLTQGTLTITNILFNILSIIKTNPTAYVNLLAKCTTVTKPANDTVSAISGAPSGKCILVRASCNTTTAGGITIGFGGFVNTNTSASKESTNVTFRYAGTMPSLTASSVVPSDTLSFVPFYAPFFTYNVSQTDTLTMSFLDCGA